MNARLEALKKRLTSRRPPSEAARIKAQRNKNLLARVAKSIPYVQLLLAIAGYFQYTLLPLPVQQIMKKTYIDENAFQPGQVNAYFSWTDVAAADRYAERLVELTNHTAAVRADYITQSLSDIGLPAARQAYYFEDSDQAGINIHTRLQAPKTSGSEVIVLCAPWQSRQDGMVNIRGISLLLALARHFQKLSVWSKDVILLFADDAEAGTQAWLHSFHKYHRSGLTTQSLALSGGSIWGAVVIDYPYHSFSHMGVFYDGINGRLPNLDLVTAALHISKWVGGAPVRLHNQTHLEPHPNPSLTATWSRYKQRAIGLARQSEYGFTTRPSGPEGLFGQYSIDAVGLFGVPAEGPYGFHTMGRSVESLSRALNNLIERLHASFFLYMLPEPFQFLIMATYLSAPLLSGASLTVAGLRKWHSAHTGTGLSALSRIVASYAIGMAALRFSSTYDKLDILPGLALSLVTATVHKTTHQHSPIGQTVLSFALLQAGMLISVATILNYALGAALSLLLGVPLFLAVYIPSKDSPKYATAKLCIAGMSVLAVSSTISYLASLGSILNISDAPVMYYVYLCLFPVSLQTTMAMTS